MKILLTVILFILCGTSSFGQQALTNKPPKVFGPVKSIRYELRGYDFNRDKTRIEELVSNRRTVTWSLTAQGQPLTSEVFEADGRPSGTKSLYKYDPAGRLTSIVNYLLGSLSFTETFAYPEANRVNITRVFESDKHSEVEIDDYDSKGNITKATFYEDGSLDQTEFYKYDDKGNPTEFVATDSAGKIWIKETYRYEFDSYGNWTTERDVSLANPRLGVAPKTTVTRKITYY
jgi:YD repeat-containing protein